MRTKAVRHAGMFTDKPEKMIDFYERVLGFRKVWDQEENVKAITGLDLTLRTIKLSSGNGSQVEFLVPKKLEKRRQNYDSGGITHIALTVEGIDDIFLRCKDYQVEMLTGKVFVSDVSRKIFFVKDPDGNILELVEDP